MIIKIILSIILGFIIGLEREKHGKSVGIRTLSLVTLGSTLFCLMSPDVGDNSRIVAQIVSGISFICIGVIFKENQTVKGLTTAMVLWAAAAIGCLVGMNLYVEAILGTVAIVIINICFKYFKKNEVDRENSVRNL